MRSTHPFELEEVMAYLDGEISADRASEIAQHMQQCGKCRELAAGFRNLSQQLAAWEWAGSGSLATILLLAITLPTLMMERTAPLIVSHHGLAVPGNAGGGGSGTVRRSQREELQALQKRMAQDEVSRSLENGDSEPVSPQPPPQA